MKKLLRCLLFPLLFALLLNVTLATIPLQADDPNGIVLTGVALHPPNPFPDQQGVNVTLTYENQGTDQVTQVPYRIEVWPPDYTDLPEDEQAPSFEADLTDVIQGGLTQASGPRSVTTTINAPAKEGDAEIRVYLPAGTEKPAMVVQFPVESALPSQVGKLFAALGVFIAMMAIMAVGTEVIVDSIKFVFGMKRKITALEAYNRLKAEIPGRLESLGVDADSRKRFQDTCEGIDGTLATVEQAVTVTREMREGHFGKAFEALEQIQSLDPTLDTAQNTLETLKDNAKFLIPSSFAALQERLDLPTDTTETVKNSVLAQIDLVRIHSGQSGPAIALTSILDEVVRQVQRLVKDTEKDWTQTWMKQQADAVVNRASASIEGSVSEIAKALGELGFDSATVDGATTALRQALCTVRDAVDAANNEYLRSTYELLRSVRDLRKDLPDLVLNHGKRAGFAIAVAAVIAALVLWRDPARLFRMVLWIGGLVGLVSTAIAALVSRWKRKRRTRTDAAPTGQQKQWVKNVTRKGQDTVAFISRRGWLIGAVSIALLAAGLASRPQQTISLIWIAGAGIALGALLWAMGTSPTDLVPQAELGRIKLASVLVEQESKHQLEEGRRAGALKVVSFVVGVFLAYHLRIDAFDFLRGSILSSATISTINKPVIPNTGLTVGILLTGMAATAGSAFWHDQLDRLQSAKRQAESTAKTVKQVREQVSSNTQGG